MAYVRRTDTLVDAITHKVREMSRNARRPYQSGKLEYGMPEYTDAVRTAENAAYSDYPEARGKLPDTWLRKTRMVRMAVKDNEGNHVISTDIEAPDEDKITLPAHIVREGWYSTNELPVYPDHMTPAFKNWVANAKERESKLSELTEQFNVIEEQLKAYMRSHASLNTALKDMPELEMYVPEEYMIRYRQAAAPKKSKVVTDHSEEPIEALNIDRNQLAAIAIANRVTG